VTRSGAIDAKVTLASFFNPFDFILDAVVQDNSAAFLDVLIEESALILGERGFVVLAIRRASSSIAAARRLVV